MNYKKFDKISLKNHPELKESWVQDRIAEDPSILGLGEVVLKDKERPQPRAGRLDLLLQDVDGDRRYEVEVQLGTCDESHIIRTIEYWDIERKRYPQYEHTTVIIAEDITSRFLNVVSLFNGTIPLVAIQMNALSFEGNVGLMFTTVLDQLQLGLVDEDEELQEVTDRNYWENRGSKETVRAVDHLLEMTKANDSSLELKYNKFYIGLARNGQADNFIVFRPRKGFVCIEPRLSRSDEIQQRLDDAGLDVMDYGKKWGRYRIRLTTTDIADQKDVISQLIKEAFDASRS